MARFLCTADGHLGKGAALYPERLSEQEQVWRTILEMACEFDVDAVLYAGDMFDSRRPTPDVVLAAERPLVEHSANDGCPVLVVSGNHDIPSREGACGLDVLAEAGLIRLARTPEVWTLGGANGFGAHVCALPWTPAHLLLATTDGTDRARTIADVGDMLVDVARKLAGDCTLGLPTILLGHWSVSGSLLPSGAAVAGLAEPVIPLEPLAAIGFDHVVLGHIHRKQEMAPGVFYMGSPMPLDHGDTGAHGVWLLDTDDGTRTFIPVESRRFVTIDRGPNDAIHVDEIQDAVVRVRVRVTEDEARSLDVPLLREMVERSAHVVTGVHVEVQREERERPAAVADDVQPADALAAWLDYRGINGTLGAGVIARAGRYLEGASS